VGETKRVGLTTSKLIIHTFFCSWWPYFHNKNVLLPTDQAMRMREEAFVMLNQLIWKRSHFALFKKFLHLFYCLFLKSKWVIHNTYRHIFLFQCPSIASCTCTQRTHCEPVASPTSIVHTRRFYLQIVDAIAAPEFIISRWFLPWGV
jgi:hypothetical protein